MRATARPPQHPDSRLPHWQCGHADDAVGTDAVGNVERKALAREPIDDCYALEVSAFGAYVQNVVVGQSAPQNDSASVNLYAWRYGCTRSMV